MVGCVCGGGGGPWQHSIACSNNTVGGDGRVLGGGQWWVGKGLMESPSHNHVSQMATEHSQSFMICSVFMICWNQWGCGEVELYLQSNNHEIMMPYNWIMTHGYTGLIYSNFISLGRMHSADSTTFNANFVHQVAYIHLNPQTTNPSLHLILEWRMGVGGGRGGAFVPPCML